MNNILNVSTKKLLAVFCLLTVAAALLAGCNKSFHNTLPGGQAEPVPNPDTRKILLIVVDGGIGAEVQKIAPPIINGLADFSIYSWDGLSDYKSTDVTNALAWSTLLTGVNSDKHKVTGADFAGNNLANYPSLFTRLKQTKPDIRTAAFSASAPISQNLTTDATVSTSFADDAAVKTAVVGELANQNPGMVMAQFHSADAAGTSGTYTAADAGYKTAVLKVDSYVGEILTALRARSNFSKENWMVIIASNKGSNTAPSPTASDKSAFGDARRNTFFFCYTPRLNSQYLAKPSTSIPYVATNAPLLTNDPSKNMYGEVVNSGTTYDFGATGDFTIECKVKMPTGNYNYCAFLSKRQTFGGGVVGWCLFMENNYWQVNFGQTALGNRQVRGDVIADGLWHTLTVVVRMESGVRNVYTYTDGKLWVTATRNLTAWGNINSPANLRFGYVSAENNNSGLQNYNLTDIKIYDAALPDAFISSNYCKTEVAENNPYLNNLAGYWSGTNIEEINGQKVLVDKSKNGKNFILNGSFPTGGFNELSNNLCPSITDIIYKTIPNSADVTVQIYRWLGIIVPEGWQLDGKTWIPLYIYVGG